MILIAYDGSVDPQAAIDGAGELLEGQSATVLTVWERLADVVARTGASVGMGDVDFDTIDRSSQGQALSGPRKARKTCEARRPEVPGVHHRSRALDRVHDARRGR